MFDEHKYFWLWLYYRFLEPEIYHEIDWKHDTDEVENFVKAYRN